MNGHPTKVRGVAQVCSNCIVAINLHFNQSWTEICSLNVMLKMQCNPTKYKLDNDGIIQKHSN